MRASPVRLRSIIVITLDFADRLEDFLCPGILIIDTKNDLNVYLTAADSRPSCCGLNASPVAEESACCSAETPVGGCVPRQTQQNCCQPSATGCGRRTEEPLLATNAQDAVASLSITDFNEWAGKIGLVSSASCTRSNPEFQGHSKSMR